MYRSAIKTIFFVFAILISFSSCNVSSSDEGPKLTPEDAINSLAELSPTAGAQFYVDNRNDFPFLDTLYVDNIVPIIGLCGFDTIKVVKERVENTPADDALEIFTKIRGRITLPVSTKKSRKTQSLRKKHSLTA